MGALERYFRGASFLRGAAAATQFPADRGAEAAFVGRSNAGKSSAINSVTGTKALARTSKTPGRTREINFFSLGEERRLVDLPGYGFAKVSAQMRDRWGALVEDYLSTRGSLRGVVLIMDARRPLEELDWRLIAWCAQAGLAVHALLTKCDKLSRSARAVALRSARESPGAEALSFQLFSATRSIGVEEAHERLHGWLWGEGGRKKPRLHNRGGRYRNRGQENPAGEAG